jgi:hypothetical protein
MAQLTAAAPPQEPATPAIPGIEKAVKNYRRGAQAKAAYLISLQA